jgi:general secretion pathway protein L
MTEFVRAIFSAIGGLVQWWVGEIAGMVPERLRRRFTPRADRLVLLLGQNDDAALYLETRHELRKLGEIDLRGEADPAHKVATILHRQGLSRELSSGRLAAGVRLGAERVLRTTVDLPLAAEANLSEVVSFELDRHTPFHADQAAFAHRVIERDVAAQRLRVNLTVVPRPLIADALAIGARLRLEPKTVDVAERGGNHAASGNLLPDAGQGAAASGPGVVTYTLAATAAGLAMAILVLHVLATQRVENAVADALAATKKSLTAAVALDKEIDALTKDERFLVDRKRERMTVTRLLLDTTQILPNDTWLSDWGISGDEVQLSGNTESASALVEKLEQSHKFKNTTFQSPTVQDAHSGRERFHFSVRVVGDAS